MPHVPSGESGNSAGNRAELTEAIRAFRPENEQEEADKKGILAFLAANENAFTRDNIIAHMTASAWVVNHDRTKVLMVYHKIYDSWSWTGGHADGEENLLAVALREVTEETGVSSVTPVYLHMNVTYLLEADEEEPLTVCEDENKGVAWFGLDEALSASSEPWFVQRIYRKLNEKLRKL